MSLVPTERHLFHTKTVSPVPQFNSIRILSSKLAPPRVMQGQIQRMALLERLAAWRAHRLTLITAPAGYGKSTLVSQCIQDIESQSSEPFSLAWLTLDAEDDTPSQFLTCLTAALSTLTPTTSMAVASAINGNHLQPALQHLLVGMEQTPSPILVVLDDFHHIRSPSVQQLVTAAIERSPASCHWMVLTRHAPPAKLTGKLRLQGELLEITTDELRLSHAEIKAVTARFTNFQLGDDAIDLLEQRMQGWIAGIHLAMLSLQQKPAGVVHTSQDLDSHLRGSNRLLAEYLTGEVLTKLPDPLRTFLLQCSILDRLHPDLCYAITEQENSAFLLEQAMTEQLFIRVVDVEGEWYEQHPVFRELLRRQLHLQLPAAKLQTLYRTAADWFLAHEDLAQSLHYLVKGGMMALAAALLSNHTRSALLSNRLAQLRYWFSMLPVAALDSQPQLLLDRAWLGLMSAADLFADALARAEAVLGRLSDLPATWRDELAVLQLWQRQISNDHTGVYADALKIAAGLAPESVLARGWCWLVVVITSSAPVGAPIAAHAQTAAAAFEIAGCEVGRLLVIGWQAAHYAQVGDVPSALIVCEQAHQLIARQQYSSLDEREYFDFLAGEIHYWLDRPQEAAVYFHRALNDARMRSDALPILRATACLQLCELALGKTVDLTDAQIAEETALWRQNEQAYTIGIKSNVVLWQIQRWLMLGRPLQAWEAYQQLGVTVETTPTDAPETLWMVILQANVAVGRDLESLTPHLERLLTQSEQGNLRVTMICARLLLTHQQQQLGHHHRARTILRHALHDIERTGYVRLLLDYPMLLPVVRTVDTLYAQEVVARIHHPVSPYIRNNLTDQESAILGHLVQGAKIADIAATLVVSQSTVKWHLTNLYAKLGVKNQREAVAMAIRMRLNAR